MTADGDERDPLVLDASAILRSLFDGAPRVEQAVRGAGLVAPSLVLLEVANALVNKVRWDGLAREAAEVALRDVAALPVGLVPMEQVISAAFEVALAAGLSAYDASYVAVAAQRRAPLLTADRKLAAAYEHAELII